jgi:methylase of polypeptide subunit release factors
MRDALRFSPPDLALLGLLQRLEDEGYDFVTPTPLTHARVLARRDGPPGRTWRDILGWSLPFDPSDAPPRVTEMLEGAGALHRAEGGRVRSAIRVSRLQGRLYIHSAYPTDAEDAVFLGPDSYRFADVVARELAGCEIASLVDVGGGCGVGALSAARHAPRAELTITDVNPLALTYARINAAHAGVALRTLMTDGLQGVAPGVQVILANPPYMADSRQTYRDGGDLHGGGLSLAWAEDALRTLSPGGRLLLYTGSAILDGGHDPLRERLGALAQAKGATFDYRELDPDVWGEELETPPYADVERIAVVTCAMTAGGGRQGWPPCGS